jgi:adenylyl- and sulfurtransferase ThiI
MGMALKEFDPATVDLSSPDTFAVRAIEVTGRAPRVRSNFVNGVKGMPVSMEATG